jgi:hypothetical protein
LSDGDSTMAMLVLLSSQMNERDAQTLEDTEINHMTFGSLIQGEKFKSVFLKYRCISCSIIITLNTLSNRIYPKTYK